MNYQEAWDIAHAIGYHRGQMRKAQNTRAIQADREAFDAFMEKVPLPWRMTAIRAHDAGITEADG